MSFLEAQIAAYEAASSLVQVFNALTLAKCRFEYAKLQALSDNGSKTAALIKGVQEVKDYHPYFFIISLLSIVGLSLCVYAAAHYGYFSKVELMGATGKAALATTGVLGFRFVYMKYQEREIENLIVGTDLSKKIQLSAQKSSWAPYILTIIILIGTSLLAIKFSHKLLGGIKWIANYGGAGIAPILLSYILLHIFKECCSSYKKPLESIEPSIPHFPYDSSEEPDRIPLPNGS